jgi:hypothetical protein
MRYLLPIESSGGASSTTTRMARYVDPQTT